MICGGLAARRLSNASSRRSRVLGHTFRDSSTQRLAAAQSTFTLCGVAPRTAQAAMRHSRIDLTMNVYTDPKLLDIHGALDVLPALPLDAQREQPAAILAATGTDDSPSSLLAPNSRKSGTIESFPDKTSLTTGGSSRRPHLSVSACDVKRKTPLSTADNGVPEGDIPDLNRRPPEPQSGGDGFQVIESQAVVESLLSVCSRICTRLPDDDHETLESLAAELQQRLTSDECRRLAELLLSHSAAMRTGDQSDE